MKLTKAARYATAFFFLLVVLVVALGPLVAMRREGFAGGPGQGGSPCTQDSDCSYKCGPIGLDGKGRCQEP